MLNSAGQIRIIEAFLAIGVLFSALIVADLTFPSAQNLSKQKALADIGMQALMELDSNGTLGRLIAQQNWTEIKDSLDLALPRGVSFNLTVYDENMNQVNSQVIRNTRVLGREVVSVWYVCASQNQDVEFWVLSLQLSWTR